MRNYQNLLPLKNYKYLLRFLLVVFLVGNTSEVYSQSPVTFSTPGTHTWTVPPCVNQITVKVWGAGGGGGGAWVKMDNNSTDSFQTAIEACAGGGGGGGGGYTQQTYTVIPGQTYTIVVGGGGNGGTATSSNNSATDGNAGGLSSFTGNAVNLIANGGNGGLKANAYNSGWPSSHLRTSGAGGSGGASSGGAVNYSGGNGSTGSGSGSFDFSGAGGGGAGSNGNGGNANATTIPHTGGTGGTGAGNGANGKNIISGSQPGNNATGIAGGGAAAVAHTTGYGTQYKAGGNGGNGAVIIEYVSNGTPPAQPTITGNLTIPCEGGSQTYSVTGVSGETYTWTYSGSATPTNGTGTSFTMNNITSGGTLTVTPSNACGNGTPRTITLTMQQPPNQPPAITGGSTTIACGGSANGTYSVTGVSGETYTWTYSGSATPTNGTGTSFTMNNITSAGTLTVTPSNACGNGTPRTITLTMQQPPAQPSTINGNTTIPCGGSANGTYSVTGVSGETYTWTYSGSATPTNGTGTSFTMNNITTAGTLTVTPSNACGNGTPRTITLTMQQPPAQPSTITGSPTSICSNTSGTYSVTNVAGVTYNWSYSGTANPTSGTGNSFTMNNITSGGTLTVTPSIGTCNGTPQTIAITTINAPAQPSAITGNTTIACGGATGTYSVTNETGVSYTWAYSGTGTVTGTGNSISLNATTGGTLTVTPSVGTCNGTPQTITITTDNAPAQPSAITGNTTIACGGATGTYSVTNVPGVTYTWAYSGTGTITGTGNSITLNATAGGTLTVTPSIGTCNGTPQTVTITTDNAPAQPSAITGNTTIACGGATGTYSVTNVTGVTYTWTYSGTGTITGTGNSISLNATTGGTLTVTPSNACGNGTPQTITITTDNTPAQPSAITGNTTIACGGASGTYSITNVTGVTYTWTYSGTGTITGTGNSISLNATTGGTLTVTPSNACGNGTPQTITITTDNAPAQPSAITGNNTAHCIGTTGVYSVANVNGVTYTWSYSGTGTITGTGNSISLNATTGGTLTVTPSIGTCNGTPQTILITIKSLPTQPATISGNTTIGCSNNNNGTYSVTAESGTTYTWNYSGTATPTSGSGTTFTMNNITSGGTLTVTPSNTCGNGTTQTINITVNSLTLSTTNQVNINCSNNNNGSATISVSGGTAPYQYNWSPNGVTTATATNLAAGTYTVTVTDATGCSNVQIVTITGNGGFNATLTSTGTDCGVTIPNGSATAIPTGGSGTYTYQWSNGQVTSSITDLATGYYSVLISDGTGCTFEDSIYVGQNNNIAIQTNPGSATILEDENVNLNVTINPYVPGSTYSWQPSGSLSCNTCPNPTASPTESTNYIVTITTPDGCVIDTNIWVNVKIKCGEYMIPTMFSPNGDGKNDVFMVYGRCIKKLHLKIFNRWGEVVHESNDINIGWDGYYKGQLANSDTFTYIIDIGFIDGTTETAHGTVGLVR